MDIRTLPTQRLKELTKTETDKQKQKAIVHELVTRGAATVITESDDLDSIRKKVMAVTPKTSIPPEWME